MIGINKIVVLNMDIPEKVYKYRTWKDSYHKNILLYNELYLASPSDFNDPFDCRIAPDFINATEEEINKWLNELSVKLNVNTKDLARRLENRMEFQRWYENEVIFKDQDKYYGILSLSCKWDSILMWSHYSESHKGFCVGFCEEKLRNCGNFNKAGIVNYDTIFPNIKPKVSQNLSDIFEKTFIQTHTKSQDWDREYEYRLIQNYFDYIPKPVERVIRFEDDVFTEVILGINITEKDKAEIVEICKKKKIPVFQAIKKQFVFQIEKEEII